MASELGSEKELVLVLYFNNRHFVVHWSEGVIAPSSLGLSGKELLLVLFGFNKYIKDMLHAGTDRRILELLSTNGLFIVSEAYNASSF